MSGMTPAARLARSASGRRWHRLDAVHPAVLFVIIYVVAIVAGIGIGIAAGYARRLSDFDFDEIEYWRMASQIMDGSFNLLPRRTAAYPLILATIRLISQNLIIIQIIVTSVFALSAPLLFLVIRRLSGSPATGAIAGLVFAVWPPTTYFGASLYSETAALPAFLLALWLIPLGDRVADRPTPLGWRAAFIAGILLALTTQIRSMYLLFVPFALLAVLVEERRWRIACARAVLLFAGFTLTTLPWSIYMTARFHHPIIVTANGGETLAGGLSPRLLHGLPVNRLTLPDRSTWVGPGKWLPLNQNGYLSVREQQILPYDQQDALLRQRAVAWASGHPWDALYIESCKIGYMWGVYRIDDNGFGQLLLGSIPIVGLLIAVLVALARRPQLAWTTPRLWVVPLFVSLVALISWGSWRFREPADAALIGMAAMGWANSRMLKRHEESSSN